ncbi:MAG: mannan-binding lectin [Sphingomonas sp.]|jgi:hypothetical protein|uniref:mannan-binding lectin n=1 Tax=Sphingomonas sp. TaxID=28214 RepID=UPI0025D63B64|nr:mannan-binding lectin [Sphingomonas sp.]MBX9882173.1 mannan-binding lectin [Sphingomonas sp.]
MRTTLGLAVLLMASSAAAQDYGRPEGYEGRSQSATTVSYDGGRFVDDGGGNWTEFGQGSIIKARFQELARGRDWIDLNDPSRDIQIRLHIGQRVILITEHGGAYRLLYRVTGIANDGPRYGRRDDWRDAPRRDWAWRDGAGRSGRTVTRDLDSGPIWNQRDAEGKCPAVARRAGGEWTGNWRTVQVGSASVCEVRFNS